MTITHQAPINWNDRPSESAEQTVWNKLVQLFWVPEKFPVSNDIPSWNSMTEEERDVVTKVFAGLTVLDTLQTEVGMNNIVAHALDSYDAAVVSFFQLNEAIHARSYSYIGTSLNSSEALDESFEWAATDPLMQERIGLIKKFYVGDDKYKMRAASCLLENGQFYQGFTIVYWFASKGLITNAADVISRIQLEEQIHGWYMGLTAKNLRDEMPPFEAQEYVDWTYDLAMRVYELEVEYTKFLYDRLGLTDTIMPSVRDNLDRALMNLGLEPMFPAELKEVHPSIASYIGSIGLDTHDFFSASGSTYVIGTVEETSDDDWSF